MPAILWQLWRGHHKILVLEISYGWPEFDRTMWYVHCYLMSSFRDRWLNNQSIVNSSFCTSKGEPWLDKPQSIVWYYIFTFHDLLNTSKFVEMSSLVLLTLSSLVHISSSFSSSSFPALVLATHKKLRTTTWEWLMNLHRCTSSWLEGAGNKPHECSPYSL